jgi:hypothetical protein
MTQKMIVWLALLAMLATGLVALLVPAPVYAIQPGALTPTPTSIPISPAKVGSNANLAIGALVLVVIILFGVALNVRRKK